MFHTRARKNLQLQREKCWEIDRFILVAVGWENKSAPSCILLKFFKLLFKLHISIIANSFYSNSSIPFHDFISRCDSPLKNPTEKNLSN